MKSESTGPFFAPCFCRDLNPGLLALQPGVLTTSPTWKGPAEQKTSDYEILCHLGEPRSISRMGKWLQI